MHGNHSLGVLFGNRTLTNGASLQKSKVACQIFSAGDRALAMACGDTVPGLEKPGKPMEPFAEKARAHLKIHGRVQGVYFRASTVQQRPNLGLTGWV